jgi:phage tail sheath protein FI
LIEAKLFQPNDVVSWHNLFNAFKLFLRDLQSNRAIDTFEYIGDQDADTIQQATYNTLPDIQAGKYKFKIKFVPITLMEEITATFTVVNSIVTVEVA